MFVLTIAAADCIAGQPQQTYKSKPLRDGFVLIGVDGRLIASENGYWRFQFAIDVSDDKGRITAGQSVRLLPCVTLEKMLAGGEANLPAAYRLWARVTAFENENFMFPIYFLPLSETEPNQPEQQKTVQINVNEPNDAVVIPEDVVQMLKPRRIINLAQLEKGLTADEDSILADRTGFIVKQQDTNTFSFKLDAMGQKLDNLSFRLLPCQTLEKAWTEQQQSLDPSRYKAAGILTKFKGEYYLLLQRAVCTYSHDNFSR